MTISDGANAMTDWSWIAAACSRDPGRFHLSKPFRALIGDQPWSVATDGRCMLLVPGGDAEIVSAAPAASVQKLIEDATTGRMPLVARLPSLRAWACAGIDSGAPCEACGGAQSIACPDCKDGKPVRCGECHGDGTVECDMGHEHDCEECDGTGRAGCDCNGTGKTECPTCRHGKPPEKPARLGGVAINRWLLARMLADAPGETATVYLGGEYAPIGIVGEGWTGVLMPMRHDVAEPAFSEWNTEP